MRDVGERPAVDEGRGVFQRLYQVGFDGILEQCSHGTLGIEVAGAHRFFVTGVGHDDVAQPGFEVFAGRSQAKDRHDFRGHHNVKTVFARIAVVRATQ